MRKSRARRRIEEAEAKQQQQKVCSALVELAFEKYEHFL